VFNYPDGDTLSTKFQSNASYYQLVRQFGRNVVWDRQDYLNGPVILSSASPNNAHFYELQRMYGAENVLRNKDYFGEIIARPVDKRENFIKRCIGIPGDRIEIIDSKVFINGIEEKNPGKRQFKYSLSLDTLQSKIINPARLQEMDITEGYRNDGKGNYYNLTLSSESLEKIRSFGFVKSVEPEILPKGFWDPNIFPFDSAYAWNVDNFGPVWVPKKGTTIPLTSENICFYRRIISVFEGNHLEEKENKIYINGKESDSYTFKMDYYWMMGDNRHNSADSRYWGFVPEDHIVGTAVFVWLSLDPNKTLFTGKIRFNKLFRIVK
jgi:signal peptidase I